MNWKKTSRASLLGALMIASNFVQAQDIHFTQFGASPLTINPAFTGYHNGMWRASAIYRNQWATVTVPYVTTGVSFDLPLAKKIGQDDYLAAGVEMYSDKSGDASLLNNTVLGSVAYHKFLGRDARTSISLGLQGGFGQKSIDLSELYFSDQYANGGYSPGTTSEILRNKTSNMLAAIGMNFGHAFGEKFAIQLGAAAHNLNQPKESLLQKPSNEFGLPMRINSQLGAIWNIGERVSIRPAVLLQAQASASELIAGTEVNVIMGEPDIKSYATRIFLGGYSRIGDANLVTGGLEFKGFRVGASYDITASKLKTAGTGVSGFEVGITYVKPNPLDFARRVFFPCARF
jgi:type IX secretion system PorP/SprF family membrane protein